MKKISEIEKIILNNNLNEDDIEYYLNLYWKQYEAPNLNLVQKYMDRIQSPQIIGLCIRICADMECREPVFWEKVLSIVKGAPWDDDEDARLHAIIALRKYPGPDKKMIEALKFPFNSKNNVIKDTVCVLAQYKVGIESRDVLWGNGSGDLINKISPNAINWVRNNLI